MRHADRPSGPGKPLRERAEATTEQEELDELAGDADPNAPLPADPGQNARHADRNAHGKVGRDGSGDNASGGS